MRVRVYDKANNRYYQSEVYAIIDDGWYGRYLVLEPCGEKRYLKLVDYFDKSANRPDCPVNINMITPDRNGWVFKKESELKGVNKRRKAGKGAITENYAGVPWVFTDSRLLASLIAGEAIEIHEAGYSEKILNTLIPGWNYIENRSGIDSLMKAVSDFDYMCLKSLDYVSGTDIDEYGMIPTDETRRITMVYIGLEQSTLEMVFEGVTALNLRPAGDNMMAVLYGATILLQDEAVYFFDDEQVKNPESYEGTWVKAFSLRWRLVP